MADHRSINDILANHTVFTAYPDSDGTCYILATCHTGTGYIFTKGIGEAAIAEWICRLLNDGLQQLQLSERMAEVRDLHDIVRLLNKRLAKLEQANNLAR